MGDASCLVPHPREGEHAIRLEILDTHRGIQGWFFHHESGKLKCMVSWILQPLKMAMVLVPKGTPSKVEGD